MNFDQYLCKKLLYKLNPRALFAFGNFFRWKCQCFTSDGLNKLIGTPKNLGRMDPTQDVTLNAMEAETKGNFESDAALKTLVLLAMCVTQNGR